MGAGESDTYDVCASGGAVPGIGLPVDGEAAYYVEGRQNPFPALLFSQSP